MLRGGELVGVWPEGFKGIGKPYSERYKLQRFGRGGFVSAALRTGVPIVPLSVVGAEEIYPLVGNVPSLARLLGIPYIPITPFFPALGPLGLVPLPSKWILEFGEPIRTDELRRARRRGPDAGLQRHRPGARDDPADALPAADEAASPSSADALPHPAPGPGRSGRERVDDVADAVEQRVDDLVPELLDGVLRGRTPAGRRATFLVRSRTGSLPSVPLAGGRRGGSAGGATGRGRAVAVAVCLVPDFGVEGAMAG